MGLEEEFGLFQRTGKNGRLIRDMGDGALISGRPKRKLRKIVTKPGGFLFSPIKSEIKKAIRRRTKRALRRPFRKKPTTGQILVAKRKAILKRLRAEKKGKKEEEEIRKLEEEFE